MSELVQARSKYMEIPKQPGSQYTDEQRRAVIADYFVTGNITKTAAMNNMPRRTVGTWIKSEWGVELLAEVRHEKREEFDAHLTKLIDVAFDEAEDRIKNGDFRLVKTKKAIKHDDGSLEVAEDYELKRIPMGGKELVISGATVYDKRQLHRNQATAISGKSEDMKALANEFAKLSDEMYRERNKKVVSTQTQETGAHDDNQ